MSAKWALISEEQYNSWKHNPVTLAIFQYYRDYNEILQRELLQRWKGGALISQDEQEMRGRVNTLGEIVDQPYQAIKQFYTLPEVNGDDDAA